MYKNISRREFIKTSTRIAAGLIVVRYISNAAAADQAFSVTTGVAYADESGNQKKIQAQRYEGPLKVTGGKAYGIDFRAKDLAGWPSTERRTVILRTPNVEQEFLSINKEKILQEFGAFNLVSGDDVARWGCKAGAPFLRPDFYITSGSLPYYFGQPLGLLTFKSVEEYLLAKDRLVSIASYFNFGKKTPARKLQEYGSSSFLRYLGYAGNEEYSFINNDPSSKRGSDEYLQKIKVDISKSNWLLRKRVYSTQSVDPMFMEPESGLSWYDSKSKTLHLALGTQSPYDDGIAIVDFFKDSIAPKIQKVIINCCFLGGGFGGRDSSDFPIHLAIAALSEPNVSHRIVHTRSEQFQAGIKRHSANVDISLAVNPSGQFEYFHSDIKLDGGGQNNYSFVVQSVAARNAGGVYRFPRSHVEAIAFPSTNIPAGSMRGYGTFQASFGLECLIDEVANAIDMDPIELRKKNIIRYDENIQTGIKIVNEFNAIEVLNAASNSALWRERQINKNRNSSSESLYGTGFAFGAKTFGKGDDACLAGLLMDRKGRLFLMTNGVEMGNGSATTLPLSLKEVLGRPADGIQTGASTEFDALKIFDSFVKSDAEQQKMSKDPFWVPLISMSTAASTSAYQLRHAVLEAGKILLQFGIWPAAVSMLGLKGDDAQFNPINFRLSELSLIYKDGRSLSFEEMASKCYEIDSINSVMVHAFYRTRWAKAKFKIDQQDYKSEIDALSIRRGGGGYTPIPRTDVDFPSFSLVEMNANRISCYSIIVAVEVSKSTGNVRVVDAAGFLECGTPIQADIVEGQMQGAFAMGIGQALTEEFSKFDSVSPGSGNLNLHLYRVPLARDCAVGDASFTILPSNPTTSPKGMSEVVFNPVSSAIVNAVADATGKRFNSLPLNADLIKLHLS